MENRGKKARIKALKI